MSTSALRSSKSPVLFQSSSFPRFTEPRPILSTLKRPFAALLLMLASLPAFAALGASVTLASGQPGLIYPGENTQLEITLSNSNTATQITALGFSNSLPGTLPNGLKITGAATYTCTDPATAITAPGAGSLTAAVGTQAITLVNGIIPARAASTDGTCTIIVPVSAGTTTGAAATYTYTINGGAVTGNDGGAVANVGAVNQSINIRLVSLPTLSKSFTSSLVFLGGTSTTLSITVTNPNPIPLPNFSITDNFPVLGGGGAIIQVAPAPAQTPSCTGGGTPPTFTPKAGDTSVTATGGTVAANSTCTVTVAITARHTNGVYDTGARSNTINGTTGFSNDLGLIPANASANITARAPLSVAKAFANAALSDGQSDTFTITWGNSGTAPLVVNSFTDSPIDNIGNAAYGLKLTADPTAVCTGAGVPGTFARNGGNTGFSQTADTTIAPGGSCTITGAFTATVQTTGTPISYTNSIAQGAIGTVAPGVVSQAASSAVLVADEMRVLKSASPGSAAPGHPVRFTVTVENYSNAAINNVVVTDTFTNGLTFLTGIINGNDFTPTMTGCGGLSVTGATGAAAPAFTIGTLPARVSINTPGTCNITFYAMVATGAANGSTFPNSFAGGTVCYNAGGTCNGGSSNTTGGSVNASVLAVAKTFGLSSPRPEGTIVRMTFTLTSLAVNPMTNVSIADTLPVAPGGGQMRVATPPNAASTCGSPTITAVANSTSIAMNGGTIPARAGTGTGSAGSCVVQVDIVGAAGVYTNTVSVDATDTYANGTTHTIGPITANGSFTFSSALSAVKSFNPTNVSSGGKAQVTVRMANSSAVVLSNVSVTDPLPAGMVLANPPNAYTTCSGSTSVTAAAGAGTVTLNGADIAGNGNCDFLFDVIATGAANWTNTIPIGNITANGGVRNQSAVSATLSYNAPNNPAIAKATNPSTLTFPGQVSVLTITISNGTMALTNMRLTDYFTTNGTSGAAANGMAIASTPTASTTCPGGVVTAVPGATSVALSGATLAANASCTITVNVTSTTIGGITNFIPIGSILTDQGLTNTGQATTSLTTQSNVGIVKKFTPNVIKPAARSRLRITFYNATAQPVTALAVTDTLPAGVTVASGPNPMSTCVGATVSSPAANQVQVSGGTIPAASGGVAGSCYAEIDVTAVAQGDYVNTIPANAITATSGGAPATNSVPTVDILRVKSPLVIHKGIAGFTLDAGNPVGLTTGSANRTPGASATLTIRIDNPNAAQLTAASFTDTLPVNLVVATTPNAATTCASGTVTATASGTSIRLSGATVPAAGFCTVSVDVVSNISGTYVNTVAAAAITTFEGVSNEDPTSAQLIVSIPPTVAKQFAPVVIPPNGISTLSIVLGNSNASSITLTSSFVDTLPSAPGNIRVAATPNKTSTCGGGAGAVTAVAAAATITLANGNTIPSGGCTITVDVTGATPGVHTNNVPAGALQTSFGNNQLPANATLTVSTLGYVSGRVFRDNNLVPNGTYQAGTDTPLANVSIELRTGASCAGALVVAAGLTNPTLTDVLGNYAFTGLAAGTYSVCEPSQPAGTSNGITTAGTITAVNGSTGTAGTASNPSATTSQIVGIVLNGNGGGGEISGSPGNDFAEIVLSSIAGTVFLDQNNNGIKNGADAGISGVTINLTGYSYGPNGIDNAGGGDDVAVSLSSTTNVNGDYSFAGLSPGRYTVTEPTQPPGTANGLTIAGVVPNGGTVGTATNVTTLPSSIAGIVLPPNTASTANNFAEIPNGRALSGRVFLDYNNNGLLNGPDHGIGAQTINLSGTDINGNAVSNSTTTAVDGTYSFTGLPEGTYSVTQPAQPAGTTNGLTVVGSTGGAATAVGVVPSVLSAISLVGANTVSAENNFAEIPGAVPDLAIAKTHSPSSFAAGGNTGYYVITPSNIGVAATSGTVTVVDTLPAGITVRAAATGAGWACVGAIGAGSISCTSNTVIAAGATGSAITLPVDVAAGLAGQVLINTAVISGGGEPPTFTGNNTATDPTAIATSASVQGHVWLDRSHTRRFTHPQSIPQPGWTVELLLNGALVRSAVTDAGGAYSFTSLAPSSGYQIRFRHPTTGLIFGNAVPNEDPQTKPYTSGVTNANNPAGATTTDGTLLNLTLLAGTNTVEQSLPLDPAGVVYNATTRAPVAGAVVTISGPGGFVPATHLVGGSATFTTGVDGLYQFLLNPTAPTGTYTLTVTTYPTAFIPLPSALIPVCTTALTVANAPNPALVQTSNTAPVIAAPAHVPAACPASTAAFGPGNQASTQYYFNFGITVGGPGNSGNVVNNHIPLDPFTTPSIAKTFSIPLIAPGGSSTLTLTLTNPNVAPMTLTQALVDTLPAGLVLATPAPVGGTCNLGSVTAVAGSNTVTYANGTAIAPGSCTITVPVTSLITGCYTNTIPSGALVTTGGSNVIATSANVCVLALPSVSKSFSAPTMFPSGIVTLTITLGNSNLIPISLTQSMIDTLPTGMTIAAPATIGGTCNGANVTAVAGGTTVSYAMNGVIPAGGCTITVPVTSMSFVCHTNTIPIAGLNTNAGSNPGAASATVCVVPINVPTLSPLNLAFLMFALAFLGLKGSRRFR
ncbi:hypothetical protein BH11PSE11_BH11PSE11_21580 [soil metagenome]